MKNKINKLFIFILIVFAISFIISFKNQSYENKVKKIKKAEMNLIVNRSFHE